MRKKVTIAGAGLVGSLEAIYLAKRGFEVEVYERRPDMRKVELSAGRSINLALSARGWNASKTVGVDQDVRKWLFQCIKESCMQLTALSQTNSTDKMVRLFILISWWS